MQGKKEGEAGGMICDLRDVVLTFTFIHSFIRQKLRARWLWTKEKAGNNVKIMEGILPQPVVE
jgi:hypothetical protein